MNNYRLINIVTGWVLFAVSTVVYLLTMEPTASFWDCGEFISSGFKLEVGHPPGSPIFMLIQNLFSQFAGGDETRVALMVNSWSAIASGLTVLFLFWTITHLAKKLVGSDENQYSLGNTLAVIGSGLVGALAYTFSDTAWFSAVEAEVYASSSFLTALVFWAILKWENVADEKHSHRWLILIAYIMGLSISVHLLNLLTIPAIVLVYYFRKYEPTRRGIILALLVSALILLFVIYVFIPGVISMAFWFELFFVNSLGLPFNGGTIIFLLLLIAFIYWAIRYTVRTNRVILNTAIVMLTVMLIGYSSYTIVLIRSSANPPMDQNNPENLYNLLYYLSRQQYGQTPLVSGHYYNAPVVDVKDGKRVYYQVDGRYEMVTRNPKYVYHDRFITLFPRMYSDDPRHVNAYKQWANIKGESIRLQDGRGGTQTIVKPTFGENLKFFFRYQVKWMYLRYFMWNFSGRQNDIQGHGIAEGGRLNGNWLSGISFIDEARLGPQDNLPDSLASNKGRNEYYMLPLLLGLIGLYFHARKHPKDFSVVFFLFFMTGLAIVLYLNQKPFEPRERDYAYAGSFYAFSIWLGLGVLGLIDLLKRVMPKALAAVLITLVSLVFVPGLMARENWDDHDRSDRLTTRDFASNYLNSCAPNAILFTNGDNDTFPLWYAQEVEGIRTDVRVVNLSYLGADWYIEEMARKAYDSDGVPLSMNSTQYRTGSRDVVYLSDQLNKTATLREAMEFILSDDPRTKQTTQRGDVIAYLPVKKLNLPINKEQVLNTGTVAPKYADLILGTMDWTLPKEMLLKNDLAVLDMLNTNNWKRPIYFAVTVARENYMNLDQFFQMEGLAYRIVPIRTVADGAHLGMVQTDLMYDNLMNKFKWGNISDPGVYLDENNVRMLANFRNQFGRLAEALLYEGKNDSARKVLDHCMELLPHSRVPHNYFTMPIVDMYYRLNEAEKADQIVREMSQMSSNELTYFYRLSLKFPSEADYEKRLNFFFMTELSRLVKQYGRTELSNETDKMMDELAKYYAPQMGQ